MILIFATASQIVVLRASRPLPPQFTVIDPADVADILDVLRPEHGLADAGQPGPGRVTGQRVPVM